MSTEEKIDFIRKEARCFVDKLASVGFSFSLDIGFETGGDNDFVRVIKTHGGDAHVLLSMLTSSIVLIYESTMKQEGVSLDSFIDHIGDAVKLCVKYNLEHTSPETLQ